MSDVMDVINAFGTPLKLAWVGWIAWGVGQYFWFRHERSMPAKKKTSVAKPVAKKATAAKTTPAPVSEPPVVGRLITPAQVAPQAKPGMAATQPEPMPQAAAAPAQAPIAEPSPMVMPATAAAPAPVFDPSTAVIEQFGAAADNVLDKFVRDFEMQDARPRRRRNPPPDAPSYGTEAPRLP